jgi:CheY-like chemotaxis protein
VAAYDVVEARHGREALARFQEGGPPISLVLTDVVMPVMGGRQLGEHLARVRPDLPLIWMSGYPRDTAFADRTGPVVLDRPFLQKPTAPEVLGRTVGDELRRTNSATPCSSASRVKSPASPKRLRRRGARLSGW